MPLPLLETDRPDKIELALKAMEKLTINEVEKKKEEERSVLGKDRIEEEKDGNCYQPYSCAFKTVEILLEKLKRIQAAISTVTEGKFAFCVYCNSPTLTTEQIDAILKSSNREDKDLLLMRADSCVICQNDHQKKTVATVVKRRSKR